MNERNEKWLDEQLKKTVDSGKVDFDATQWKQKYSAEYEELVSRARTHPNVLRFLWARPLVRVAAVITVAALAIFFMHRQPNRPVEPKIAARPEQSPAMMLSRLSLMLAYNRGGMDAVDEQCERALKLLGHKTNKVSINESLNENNGRAPERKEL